MPENALSGNILGWKIACNRKILQRRWFVGYFPATMTFHGEGHFPGGHFPAHPVRRNKTELTKGVLRIKAKFC